MGSNAGPATERFPPLNFVSMSAQQKKVAEAIVAGPRKSLAGPFNAWLRSPELASRLQALGEYLRFHSLVPARLKEFAILITAREWTAQFEWYAHASLAREAGVEPTTIADLARGKRPTQMKDDEAVIYDFCMQLLHQRAVGDQTFEAAMQQLGERGIVDLIGLTGYYSLVAMTLNIANVPLPTGEAPPLDRLEN